MPWMLDVQRGCAVLGGVRGEQEHAGGRSRGVEEGGEEKDVSIHEEDLIDYREEAAIRLQTRETW